MTPWLLQPGWLRPHITLLPSVLHVVSRHAAATFLHRFLGARLTSGCAILIPGCHWPADHPGAAARGQRRHRAGGGVVGQHLHPCGRQAAAARQGSQPRAAARDAHAALVPHAPACHPGVATMPFDNPTRALTTSHQCWSAADCVLLADVDELAWRWQSCSS